MSQALYRKYRSRSLDEVLGQDHVTSILRRALEKGKIAHAYLLTGPRGVGKTSVARILAHEINQLPYDESSTHLDIIEIDAASNNSVEDIRDLRERVQVAPVSAPKKVYIIDEVHMLSKSAFNALLKTLEEPPKHVVFILATTDADKLPATILSRVQRFNFRLISEADIAAHLRAIADAEHIGIDDAALALIAQQGQGSLRDSISLLDQLRHVSDGNITTEMIESSLGLANETMLADLLAARRSNDIAGVVQLLDTLETQGVPAVIAADQLARLIQRSALTAPDQLCLLDPLLSIGRSPWPYISLLSAMAPENPTATSAPQSIVEEARPAYKPRKQSTAETPPPKSTSKKPEPAPKKEPSVAPSKKPTKSQSTTPQELDWDAFLAPIKQSAAGAHSILVKCGHEFDGNTLTIYAGKKFAKTQLDKSLPALAESLQAMDIEAEITVLATPQPPKDSQAAAIIAMMGGGEEVSL